MSSKSWSSPINHSTTADELTAVVVISKAADGNTTMGAAMYKKIIT